jgi:hypothetical protein
MTCSSCTMGTGLSAILVDHFSVIARAAQADALPSEYVEVHPHWDPGFRIIYPKAGAQFIMVGGVCALGKSAIATVDAMDGQRWTLCIPTAFGLSGGGVMKKVAKNYGTGAATSPWTTTHGEEGWTPATSSPSLDVPVYFPGGRRARVRVGDSVTIRRVLAFRNGGPTGLLVRLGPAVRAFGSGGMKQSRGFMVLSANQLGTGLSLVGPSRSRHLQRRRR